MVNNFSDNQNFDIDINKVYNEIINSIDKIRSHVSISNNSGILTQLLKSLSNSTSNATDPNSFITQIKTDPTAPQESRCHAFYRLIGLPVIADDSTGTLYNPGYDINDSSLSSDIRKLHLQVIKGISPAFFKVMEAREDNINSFLRIFSRSNQASKIADINSSVLAIASVSNGKIRKFSSSIENSPDPFDTIIKNQSYSTSNENKQVFNAANTSQLVDYVDVNGNIPLGLLTPSILLNESPLFRRAHILKPFIVDPRVDLTVNPPNGIVCAPFALDKSKTLYAENIYLIRPFIETVCRSRFNKNNITTNSNTIPQRYADLQNYISNTDTVRDQDLLSKIALDPGETVEDEIFLKYFNIMRAMMVILHDSILNIQHADINYHWVPIPDKNGPEFGCSTQDIILIASDNGTILDPLSTKEDQDILTATTKIQLQNINNENTQTDIGNFAFQGIQTMPDDKSTQAFGDRTQNVLDELISKRAEITNSAAESLKNVEIIMGEFSGLGLCDIIAIFTALWTVDKNVLVNMLDDFAFNRLYVDATLRDPVVESRKSANQATMNGKAVLTAFETKIREMYILMDKLYEDIHLNNNSQ